MKSSFCLLPSNSLPLLSSNDIYPYFDFRFIQQFICLSADFFIKLEPSIVLDKIVGMRI